MIIKGHSQEQIKKISNDDIRGLMTQHARIPKHSQRHQKGRGYAIPGWLEFLVFWCREVENILTPLFQHSSLHFHFCVS